MVPKDLRYAETHEWTKADGDAYTIGITKFAVEQLTDVVFIDIKPKVGDKVTAGQSFGEIESVKAVSDMYAPISGEVVAVNSALTSDPASISADPFGAGWIIKVKAAAGATDKLLTPDQYEKQIAAQGH
jgi:glycine cleavage system H protein